MIISRRFAIAMGVALASSAALVGCGDGKPAPKVATVKPGNMPDGGDWTGVWYSPLYGYLHVVHEGTAVSGKWLRPVKDRWGELHGDATGDVVRFTWTEYTIGAVGPNSKKSGKGYFRYVRPEGDNIDDKIEGEIGTGDDEVGDAWDAVKQRNMMPDLDSIGGSGASDIGGGDWDESNSESGPVEEPEEPDM